MNHIKYWLFAALFGLISCSEPPEQKPYQVQTLFKAQAESVAQDTPAQDIAPSFRWHKDIISGLKKGLTMSVNGTLLAHNLAVKSQSHDKIDFHSFNRAGHLCYRVIARAYSGKSHVDFWLQVSYGHTKDSAPLYQREKIQVTFNDIVKTLDDPPIGSQVYHGQGLPVSIFRFDFSSNTLEKPDQFVILGKVKAVAPWFTAYAPPASLSPLMDLVILRKKDDKTFAPFEQSRYVPLFPGQTGGQAQFGTYHVAPDIYAGICLIDIWRRQLYQEGCRPIHFVNPDGTRAREEDWPGTILAGQFHGSAPGKHWMKYSDPRNPWRDKPAVTPRWYPWNHQHWSIGPLAQVYMLTGDPGMEMLLYDLAEVWLWSNPDVPKNTALAKAGAARKQGRTIEAGASLYWAIKDETIRARLIKRLKNLLRIQVNAWKDRKASHPSGAVPIPQGYSAWEHGLWIKGLEAGIYLFKNDPELGSDLREMSTEICTWILGHFKQYPTGLFALPYEIRADNSSGPSKGLSLWAMPAMQILARQKNSLTALEKSKLSAILGQYLSGNPTESGWQPFDLWRLY